MLNNQRFRFLKFRMEGGKFLGVACLFFLAARLGLELATTYVASPVWPATGVAMASVLVFGPRACLAIFFAAFLANFSHRATAPVALSIAFGNILEAWFAAYLWKRLRTLENLEHLSEAVAFIVASAVASMIGASWGVLSLCGLPDQACSDIQDIWLTWWCGDALGGIVVGPLALDLLARTKSKLSPGYQPALTLLTLVGTGLVTWLIFAVPWMDAARLYLIFPILFLVCWLSDATITNAATLLISVISIIATYFEIGPFQNGNLNHDLINLQLFLSSIGITAVFLNGFKKAGILLLPGAVLLVSWLLCGVIFHSFLDAENRKDEIRFAALTSEAQTAIRERVETYIDALQSGAALFAASDRVNRKEWRTFAESLNILERYPGIKAISVIARVKPGDEAAYAADAAADGAIGLQSKFATNAQPNPTGEHFPIKYIYPEAPYKSVLGLDLASEPTRRQAAELSRSTGKPVITKSLILLVQDTKGPSFIIFLPVYRKGSVLNTADDRRQNLEAWINAPFVASEFFESILGSRLNEVSVDVFLSGSRIYSSHTQTSVPQREPSTLTIDLTLGQRPFTFVWRKLPNFQSSHDTTAAWAGSIGGLVALCLASLVVSLKSVQQRSEEIARRATADLLEKKRVLADQALTLTRVMNLVPVGIFRTSAAGECQYVNAAWMSISGLTWEESLGRGWMEAVHPDDRVGLGEKVVYLRSLQKSFSVEYRLLRKDGTIREVYATSSVDTDAAGTLLGTLGTVQDVTELKQAQRDSEMQRAATIQASKMSTLGEMAGGVAHEINNPLAIILAKIIYLKKKARQPGYTFEQLTTELEKIEETTLRIVTIIKGLMAFSRSDDQDPFLVSSLPSIVEGTLALCREKFLHRDVAVRITAVPELSLECRAVQISQVLLNLLSNSFDAVVDLPEKWIEMQFAETSTHVSIHIIDSGRGIPKSLADKIMEPFFTTKEPGKGTGLGLSIAKGIVEDHGGNLGLDQGSEHTQFVIMLPKKQRCEERTSLERKCY